MPAPGETFALRLRTLREAAGLTQEELAERAGLTPHAVSALERGVRTRPYPHTVRSLGAALDASAEQLSELLASVPRRGTTAATAAGSTVPAAPGPVPLPVPVTPLVGRERDLDDLVDLVPRTRLVTLTGTGGVGKTRLALAAAAALQGAYPDGVVFVPLAPLSDPDLVLPAVGRGLGLSAEGLDAELVVREHLRDRRVLLVLDNFEHLMSAAVPVARLVAELPAVTVLVTSRAALQVRGEVEVPVHPLASAPARALFVERARAVAPSFATDRGTVVAVAAICDRLSGIPLALELAAAKVRLLEPRALLARLDEAMATAGARDLPERQRTMRSTLDWSYSLLTEEEQRLFRVLSVFTGGFTLADAEAVAGMLAPPSSARRVLPLLESLVAQSLVVVAFRRYLLLEPVAQYGRGLLADLGEAEEVSAAHAEVFARLAVAAAPGYEGADQVRWLGRIEAEDGNVTAAADWFLRRDPERAGELCWALWLYWWLRGHLLLGRRLAEAALQHELRPEVRTRATLTAAAMAFAQGDFEASGRGWELALSSARESGDVAGQAHARAGCGLVALASGDITGAEQWFLETVPLAQAAGGSGQWVLSLTHVWLGTTRLASGDPSGAVVHIERGLALSRARGDRLAIYIALFNLSQSAIARGDGDLAREHLEAGIRLSLETRDLANLAYFLEALAVVEDGSGHAEQVATLLGAAGSLRESVGANVYGYYLPDEALRESAVKAARASLGEDGYDDAFERGRDLDVEEAVALALRLPAP